MRFSILALSIFSHTVFAYNVAQTWSGDNCEGSSVMLGCGSYCYENLPGASIDMFNWGENCLVTTWSGMNCEGSSANFRIPSASGCYALPFGSVQLTCGAC